MRRHRSAGFALIWALLVIVVVAATSSVLVSNVRAATSLAGGAVLSAQGFHAAEGALANTRVQLAADPTYAGGTVEIAGFRPVVSVTADANEWRVEVSEPKTGVLLRCTLTASPDLPVISAWDRVR